MIYTQTFCFVKCQETNEDLQQMEACKKLTIYNEPKLQYEI